jgi:glutathione S-transferase
MLRFYHHPLSVFARRVRIALLEKRIEHEPIEVDLAKGAHRKPEYLALNPYGRVPTIDDDGFVLYESAAILLYLEATRPASPLLPPDTRGRALADMHLRLCDGQLARPAVSILFPTRFLPQERWDRPAMARAKADIEQPLVIVEQTLDARDYLVGKDFSVADIGYLPFLQFLPLMAIEPGPRVAAWRKRLLDRPSALATAPAQ